MIDTYQNLVFSICYKITGNYFDAEDLAQDTYLAAYKNFSKFDGNNEKAWICKIATNKCLDYVKRAASKCVPTEDTYFQELSDESTTTENTCLERLVKEQLLCCCESLKPPYDEIAKKYFYEECSVNEIANQLKRNEKTIQTQVYRAKAMLRKLYGKEEQRNAG